MFYFFFRLSRRIEFIKSLKVNLCKTLIYIYWYRKFTDSWNYRIVVRSMSWSQNFAASKWILKKGDRKIKGRLPFKEYTPDSDFPQIIVKVNLENSIDRICYKFLFRVYNFIQMELCFYIVDGVSISNNRLRVYDL